MRSIDIVVVLLQGEGVNKGCLGWLCSAHRDLLLNVLSCDLGAGLWTLLASLHGSILLLLELLVVCKDLAFLADLLLW